MPSTRTVKIKPFNCVGLVGRRLVAFARAAILIQRWQSMCARWLAPRSLSSPLTFGMGQRRRSWWASLLGRACRPPTRAPCSRRRRTPTTATSTTSTTNCRPCRGCSCTPSAWWLTAASYAVGNLLKYSPLCVSYAPALSTFHRALFSRFFNALLFSNRLARCRCPCFLTLLH